ncbi:DUF362 domain-containing protein [Geoglobus acetivorans]|uniref:Ferredoxin n=1 Tax=Geoglobus acetivorans TaxID=565033 RepID=A0A0A7GEU6_GEOAI|nr:Ferredoxin [Geoglobus acetivorans]
MSKVFFTPADVEITDPTRWYQPDKSLVSRLERLIEESSILDNIDKGDIVAVKTHFGDRGTTKMLRSLFVRKVVEKIKEKKAKIYVTETTGLGLTRDRTTAIGRIEIAEENGFTSQTVGAPIIIADGLRGFDAIRVRQNARHLKEVHVARAIAETDFVVAVTHFKLHMRGGVGGSLKNIGVGCVTKTTKFDIHLPSPPEIDKEKCTECDRCVEICPFDAIENYSIDLDKCLKCLGCAEVCEERAIKLGPWLDGDDIAERIVEAAKAVIDTVGKGNFAFLNFAIDITPHCDCHPYSAPPQVSDIGVYASNDIVSIDTASLDAYKKESLTSKALIKEKFWSWTSPERLVEYAEELGLGSRRYELEEIP